MRNGVLACAACVAFCAVVIIDPCPGAAQEEKHLPQARVELVVRSPEGRAIVNAEVRISSGEHFFPGQKRPSATVKSGAEGQASFSWPVGLRRLNVMVKGIGYGATGRFELLEGTVARPAIPPLVPFGDIEGIVAEDSLHAGRYVEVSMMDQNSNRRAPWDEAGRFVVEDLPAGEYNLLIQPDQRWVRSPTGVAILPGQHVRGVIMHWDKSQPSRETAMAFGMRPGKEKRILWAAGTVHDEVGRPLEGVDVFAVIGYYGGIRMYESIKSTKTDKAGRWEFHGSDSVSSFNGTLIACKAGRPYAAASMRSPIPAPSEENPKPLDLPAYDLVLSARGGNLEVAVSEDGKPVEGAEVRIERNHGPSIYEKHYVGSDRSPNREVLEELLTPAARTDGSGVARFMNLVPGEYRVTAVAGNPQDIEFLDSPFRNEAKGRSAQVGGVAVNVGTTRKLSVAVSPPPVYRVSVQVRRPDGQPYSRTELHGSDKSDPYFDSPHHSVNADPSLYSVYGVGLHPIEFTAADPRAHRDRSDDLPRDEAAATIGVSPILPAKPSVVLTTVRRQLGFLLVRLEDPAGKPLRGHVLVDRSPFSVIPPFAGTTDRRGEVRFQGVEPGKHEIEAFPAGQTFADLGADDDPFPADKDLLGRWIVSKQEATTSADTETRVAMRAKRAGYVRGKLRPPPGVRPDDCYVMCNDWHSILGFATHYDKRVGEFLMGPLPEGTTTIYGGPARRNLADAPSVDVVIAGDRVVPRDLVIPGKPGRKADRGPRQAFVGMGGISMLGEVSPSSRGRVFLSDGKTPAYGAALAYFVPETIPPVGAGEVDALGRIVVGGAWYSGNQPKETPPGSPTTPVLVAWLPGSCGATITPVESEAGAKDLKIVLPPPLSLAGKVTVAGKEIRGGRSQFQVAARYEGGGKLAVWLSRTVAPEADGSFTLPALTPGAYRVQAAMDNMWLSPSVRLDVRADATLQPLTLDIGQPAPATTLKVVDRNGKPVPDARATVSRPEGPLAETLWPHEFVSDGAGTLHIPPLEAGSHKLQVRGAKERLLKVPPLSDVNSIEGEPIVVAE